MISNIRVLSKPIQRDLHPRYRHAILRNMAAASTARPIPFAISKASTTTRTSARTFLSTPTRQEKHTIKVPTMGDSITEGTIVEWVVPVGASVSEGDVICLIETDKVTVDIKAERNGVVVQHLGEVEGVVEVGEGLYVLDTDLNAAVEVTNKAPSTGEKTTQIKEEAPAPAPAAAPPTTRVPSIQFLGKEGWNALRTHHAPSDSSAPSTTTIVSNAKPQSPTSITYQPYVHMYGRPSITEEEIEALMLGGAEEAPLMKKDKSGVVSFCGGKVVTAGPRGVWLAEETM